MIRRCHRRLLGRELDREWYGDRRSDKRRVIRLFHCSLLGRKLVNVMRSDKGVIRG